MSWCADESTDRSCMTGAIYTTARSSDWHQTHCKQAHILCQTGSLDLDFIRIFSATGPGIVKPPKMLWNVDPWWRRISPGSQLFLWTLSQTRIRAPFVVCSSINGGGWSKLVNHVITNRCVRGVLSDDNEHHYWQKHYKLEIHRCFRKKNNWRTDLTTLCNC